MMLICEISSIHESLPEFLVRGKPIRIYKNWMLNHHHIIIFSVIYILVVASEHGIILPIDELHHFSRWLLHHQRDMAIGQNPGT